LDSWYELHGRGTHHNLICLTPDMYGSECMTGQPIVLLSVSDDPIFVMVQHEESRHLQSSFVRAFESVEH
jgi:hypothetical protein